MFFSQKRPDPFAIVTAKHTSPRPALSKVMGVNPKGWARLLEAELAPPAIRYQVPGCNERPFPQILVTTTMVFPLQLNATFFLRAFVYLIGFLTPLVTFGAWLSYESHHRWDFLYSLVRVRAPFMEFTIHTRAGGRV